MRTINLKFHRRDDLSPCLPLFLRFLSDVAHAGRSMRNTQVIIAAGSRLFALSCDSSPRRFARHRDARVMRASGKTTMSTRSNMSSRSSLQIKPWMLLWCAVARINEIYHYAAMPLPDAICLIALMALDRRFAEICTHTASRAHLPREKSFSIPFRRQIGK